MKLTYIVNAMFLLEGAHSRVLCDPWITFDRESRSGLFNFPEVTMTREEIARLAPDFIYISHTHADHFDRPTLELFSKDTPILIAPYEENFTERNIKNAGFEDVRIAPAGGRLELNGGDWCAIEPSFVYPDVDSIAVFSLDDVVTVNANDVPYSEEQCRGLRDRYGPINLAMVPYSFQGPYPAFYQNLSPAEREAQAAKKVERSYDQLRQYVDTLGAKFYFPFAGGAVYGGEKSLLADYYGVGTVSAAVSHLAHAVEADPILIAGDGGSYDFASGGSSGGYTEKTYSSERDYLKAISAKPGPFDEGGLFYIDESQRIDLSKLLARAREKQRSWQDRRGSTSERVFFLDVGEDYLYRLCLADTSVSRVRESKIEDSAYEIFRLPYALLIGLLTGHYNWSNVKTQHMWFYRRPDVFDPELHILMSFLQL